MSKVITNSPLPYGNWRQLREAIAALRDEYGMSEEEIASHVGRDEAWLNTFLNHTSTPAQAEFHPLLELLAERERAARSAPPAKASEESGEAADVSPSAPRTGEETGPEASRGEDLDAPVTDAEAGRWVEWINGFRAPPDKIEWVALSTTFGYEGTPYERSNQIVEDMQRQRPRNRRIYRAAADFVRRLERGESPELLRPELNEDDFEEGFLPDAVAVRAVPVAASREETDAKPIPKKRAVAASAVPVPEPEPREAPAEKAEGKPAKVSVAKSVPADAKTAPAPRDLAEVSRYLHEGFKEAAEMCRKGTAGQPRFAHEAILAFADRIEALAEPFEY